MRVKHCNYIVEPVDDKNRLSGQTRIETEKIITKKIFKLVVYTQVYRVEGAPSALENGGKSYYKKCYILTICDEKNSGYRIIELICYCFLTNLGISFLVH